MFGSHHVVCAAISLAGNDGDFWHRAFGVGIQQFGTVFDDAAELLAGTRHETRHIHKGDDRNIEGIAKTHKATGFDRALDVQTTGQHQRLVGHDAHGLSGHAGKTDEYVFRVLGLQLEEVAVVHRFQDQLFHVIRHVGVVRHQRVQTQVHALSRVTAGTHRWFLSVVQRQIVVETAQHQQGFHIVVERQISHAAFGGVGDSTAQFFRTHLFVRDGFHHIRAGDKHV